MLQLKSLIGSSGNLFGISNSLDNPAVVNYFQSIYNKQFATDNKDSDFDSFFKYEKTFRTNPLSLPE